MPGPGPRFSRRATAADASITKTTVGDPVLDALSTLDDALAAANARTARMRRRIETLRAERLAGRSYTEIVSAESPPRLVEMLADATRELDTAGAEVRRAQARALYDEGMTMDEIAAWFGVSRQRVSVLLRSA